MRTMKYVALIGILIVCVTACQKYETVITPIATVILTATSDANSLDFVAIDLYETEWIHSEYSNKTSDLIAITTIEDITQLDGLVQAEQQEQLQQLDFDESFALALFQGVKPSTQYNVQVERIEYVNGVVFVFSEFIEPEPETSVGAMETSPYHIVQVSKPVDWEEKITFNLVVEGVIVASDLVN